MKAAQILTDKIYQKSLARAIAEGIYVAQHETTKSYNQDGSVRKVEEKFYVMNPGNIAQGGDKKPQCYIVNRNENRLSCNCAAAQEMLYCKHRACVTHYLISHAHSYADWSDAVNMTSEEQPDPEDFRGDDLERAWERD
jgi:hypothetical protein